MGLHNNPKGSLPYIREGAEEARIWLQDEDVDNQRPAQSGDVTVEPALKVCHGGIDHFGFTPERFTNPVACPSAVW